MSELPESWVPITLGDAIINITITDKKIPQKEYLTEGAYPIFDQGQVYIGGYTDKLEKLVECELPIIVFGDHTRAIKFVNRPFAPGADGVKVLRPKSFYNPKLFEYFAFHIATHLTDRGYARHYQHLAKSIIPLPPTNEQHRIVAKIEALFSELDKGVESFKTAREQLKIYLQALLKHAFSGKLTEQWRAENQNKLESAEALLQRIQTEREQRYQQQLKDWEAAGKQGSKPKAPKTLPPLTAEELAELPELPEGWVWDKLGWLTCSVEYGTSAKSSEFGDCPVLRMGNIQNGKFDWDDLVFTSDESEIAKYLLHNEDVLFNRTNSPELVGKTAIYKSERPAIFAGYLIRLNQIDTIVNAQYLNLFLNSLTAKQHGNKVKTDGVNQSNINGEKLVNYPFPFCSIEEHAIIVEQLEQRLSITDQLDQTLTTALQQAEALRQSILKKAFSGQLVPQDPNDEPASVLLKRIQAEKTALLAQAKTLTPKTKEEKKTIG